MEKKAAQTATAAAVQTAAMIIIFLVAEDRFIQIILHCLLEKGYTFYMQTVIIPHPTELLLLAREQKKLLYDLNSTPGAFFPLYPLFCILHSGCKIQEERKAITSFSIGAPFEERGHISFQCRYTVKGMDTIQYARIPAASASGTLSGKNNTAEIQHSIESHASFSVTCRVFRIAEAEITADSWKIYNQYWLKSAVKEI